MQTDVYILISFWMNKKKDIHFDCIRMEGLIRGMKGIMEN